MAAMVRGLWQTALVGILAGAIGTGLGVVFGFTSAYFGGIVDFIGNVERGAFTSE